jgi:predicted Rossmann fold flavoprotein
MRPVIVVGAGAAGLMAAIHASGRGRPVIVLESTTDGGRKILISGGGRCNVLPRALQPERFVSDSPAQLVRKLLRSWPLDHQKSFFEKDLGIPLKLEDEAGKYFPVSDRARDVRDRLINHARERGVTFEFDTRVTGLSPLSPGWRIETTRGVREAANVIVAAGGRSVPATGSDGAILDQLGAAGHIVHPTYPALTPIVQEPAAYASLSGVSLTVRLRARWNGRDTEATGGFLFTHRGYSGPAVLDVSHVAVRSRLAGSTRATLRVRWSALDADAWQQRFQALQPQGGLVQTALARELPARLAERLMGNAGVPAGRRAAELTRNERQSLIDALTAFELPWTSDEGYKKAEVTGGGVALTDVDPRTLESRRAPGLFLCGEILDAFGPIGGHNFAWAWATGRSAGMGQRQSITG